MVDLHNNRNLLIKYEHRLETENGLVADIVPGNVPGAHAPAGDLLTQIHPRTQGQINILPLQPNCLPEGRKPPESYETRKQPQLKQKITHLTQVLGVEEQENLVLEGG